MRDKNTKYNANIPGKSSGDPATDILDEVMAASETAEKEMTGIPQQLAPIKTPAPKSSSKKAEIVKANPYRTIREYIRKTLPTIIRNKITGDIEIEGNPVSEQALNSHYINLTASVEHPVKLGQWQTFINSDHIPSYHPLEDYFKRESPQQEGHIRALAETLKLDPVGLPRELVYTAIEKWIVGIVAGLFGNNYNSLVLVLIGPKGTGKTEFWRRLLPDELQGYFVESKLDAGKDDAAKACENLIVFVDEMDFLTRKEASEVRRFISQNYFTDRAPYARKNVKRKRIASFCGASNEVQVINDYRNNRRIIPIMIEGIHQDKYNAICKDGLIREAYKLFRSGKEWDLSSEEIKAIENATGINAVPVAEDELLVKYFTHGDGFFTASEIAAEISRLSGVKLSPVKTGKALAAHGFERKQKKINNIPVYGWGAMPCFGGAQSSKIVGW